MSKVTFSDGPVAVTGASGYLGSHVVAALVGRGYDVRACVTETDNPDKTEHLLQMNANDARGRVALYTADLFSKESYDHVVAGCCAVIHIATPMGYGQEDWQSVQLAREIYEGALSGTENVLDSVRRAGTVRRFVYTSSFAAICHPAPPGYVFTESDWASDPIPASVSPWWVDCERSNLSNWNEADAYENAFAAYTVAKVASEKLAYRTADEDGGFDAISFCPSVVLGPLLSRAHELPPSAQWVLGRMLAGKPGQSGWQHLWNVVDVRDVGEAQALGMESDLCHNGDRYQLTATDDSGELTVPQLQEHLAELFPSYEVGGPPEEYAAFIGKHGQPYDAPRAHCDKARRDLGLRTHSIHETLFETGRSLIEFGLVEATGNRTDVSDYTNLRDKKVNE
ncbi:MAG TPA: NAD-dependent epimerase/dehydratase family protein [Acidimicrobiales bacterium]|nr:NAD-dependent epimerase/dehydratase family protein [Acidimicrobiales bacterium]